MDTEGMDLSREVLRAVPKVELHLHLEGAVRLSTIRDLCQQLNVTVPGAEEDNLQGYRRMFCITHKVEDLCIFLDIMWHVQSLFCSPDIIERIAFEVCEDAYNNGVRLLEVRYSPSWMMISHYLDHSHLTFQSMHNAVLSGVRRAEAAFDLAVGVIVILDRSKPVEEEAKLLDFVLENRDDCCGIDIANDEAHSCIPFAELYRKARAAHLGLTCHAGESTDAHSVREAIEHLHVTRVGHGYLAINDPEILQLVIDRGVVMEICPISNLRANSVLISSVEEHPVRRLLDAGVKLCISSDDPGMFDSDLVDEYVLLAKHHNFTLQEFHDCNVVALNASFLPLDVAEKVRQKYFS